MPAQKRTLKATLATPNAKKPAEQPNAPLSGAGSLVIGGIEACTIRTYYNPRGNGMQPVRAAVWLKPAGGGDWRTGRGAAGGCGYHKESAALAEAVRNAGIELWGSAYVFNSGPVDMKKRVDFGGTGSSAYETIFTAIARAMGHKGRAVWVSHGL